MQPLKALWLRLHSQAMSLGKETMIFGLLQDVGDSACKAGQDMFCLISPASALQHPDGVGLLEPGEHWCGTGTDTLSNRWKTQLGSRPGL